LQPIKKQMGNVKTKLSQIGKLKEREAAGETLNA